ncbi:MAG TPA: hypothetical protein VJV05_05730 [Pyrinomonadaceae bacterium]|nr:hypothetical protein [Pyrinomonadaceae bacterium]
MKRNRLSQLLVVATFALISSFGILAAPQFSALRPGQFQEINQDLEINIVFVGYEQGAGPRDINETAFRAGLPSRYRALAIAPSLFIPSNEEEDQIWNGNSYHYNYNLVYADTAFEDAYFNYLLTIGTACGNSFFQDFYNTQQSRSLDVSGNMCVGATTAEKWLAINAEAMLGVDTTKYTVFYINWYGRADFRFHTYVPFDFPDPDPDTGTFLPADLLKFNAWGGTTPDDDQNGLGSLRRVWFYDLSAGPEFNTSSCALDPDDVLAIVGPGAYTMPPVWEYGNLSAYRPFNNLSGDLAKITRYVAIDSLFTTSPGYSPALSPPKLPEDIQLDVTVFNGDPGTSVSDYLKIDRVVSELSDLQPTNSFSGQVTEQPFSGRLRDVYLCAYPATFGFPAGQCYGNRNGSGEFFQDMFLYLRDHGLQYLEGDADYEVPVFTFFVPTEIETSFEGESVGNLIDGTQTHNYVVSSTFDRTDHGTTETTIHEIGHHLGVNHPHNGFDYESFSLYSSTRPRSHYVWAGDASDTVMSYLFASNNFSQFDRDNMNRWLTAVYINESNKILAKILVSPRAGQVSSALLSADADANIALVRYGNMNYLSAVEKAKSAYELVVTAATQINIAIERNSTSGELRNRAPYEGLVDKPRPRHYRP